MFAYIDSVSSNNFSYFLFTDFCFSWGNCIYIRGVNDMMIDEKFIVEILILVWAIFVIYNF